MFGIKEIQRRIKSVSNTKKITRAMEMVAASKMKKAIDSVLRTRTYADLSWNTVLNLSKIVKENNESENILHPLLKKKKKINKIGVILITSNRGLCAGFNTNIISKLNEEIKKEKEGETELILMGKKGVKASAYYGYKIVADFPKLDLISEIKEVSAISKMIINDFKSGRYDKIMVAYTDFVNPVKQIPRVKQLLPVEIKERDESLGQAEIQEGKEPEAPEKQKNKEISFIYDYTFEPSPREVLDEMIPRLIEVQLFQALLESNASEHSARMTAMHKATDAAKDMVSELTLFYNKARQAGITREIAEISAGANALAE